MSALPATDMDSLHEDPFFQKGSNDTDNDANAESFDNKLWDNAQLWGTAIHMSTRGQRGHHTIDSEHAFTFPSETAAGGHLMDKLTKRAKFLVAWFSLSALFVGFYIGILSSTAIGDYFDWISVAAGVAIALLAGIAGPYLLRKN